MNWNEDATKAVIGMALFGSWVALVWFNVPGREELVGAIKVVLTGLGSHYLTNSQPPGKP